MLCHFLSLSELKYRTLPVPVEPAEHARTTGRTLGLVVPSPKTPSNAACFLVNLPGTGTQSFSQLMHAKWSSRICLLLSQGGTCAPSNSAVVDTFLKFT